MKLLGVLSVFLLGVPPVFAQENTQPLTPREIILKAFEQTEKNDEIKHSHLVFKRKTIEEDFDNEEFNNNARPTPKSSGERIEVVKKGSNKVTVSGIELDLNQIFSTLYDYQIPLPPNSDTETIDGTVCMILEFTPKKSLRITKTADEFTHRLNGKFYIDRSNFNILKIEAAAPQQFEYWVWTKRLFVPIPVHIRIKILKLIFVQKYLLGIVTEDSIKVTAQYELGPFKGTKQVTYQYFDHKLKDDKLRP